MSDEPLDVHGWFGLTYANYLVLPRTVLQSMPLAWQFQFVALLREIQDVAIDLPWPSSYDVRARGLDGKYVKDEIPHYWRGRTRVALSVPTVRRVD